MKNKIISKTFYYAGNAFFLTGAAFMVVGTWMNDRHLELEKKAKA